MSFALGEGRLLGLLGRNGAGKSTCMNVDRRAAAAAHRRGRGVRRQPSTRLPPEQIAARGVALVPQGRRIFKSLTVRENLMVAARKPDPAAGTRPGPSRPCSACSRGLPSGSNQIAAHLSGGEQQMLAIGRALMAIRACC